MDQAEQLRNIIKANNAMGQATGNVPKRPLARVITVTSGKGGVGKSNTAINLAIQFRKMGQKVIILDADFGLANIEIMFGAVPKHNLCDLIYQGKNIREIITWGPMDVGFISGGSGIAGMSNLSREYLVYIIKNLAELDAIADVIIVDTGAGISDAVLEFLVASGEILLVTTPEPTSITDSYSLLKALNRHPRFSNEYSKIKEHTVMGEKLIEGIDYLAPFHDIIVGHHKYFNGNGGYPDEFDVISSEIKVFINLISICDTIDTSTDHKGRNYAKKKNFDQILVVDEKLFVV